MSRYAATLTWKTFTIFYDDSITETLANMIHEVLGKNAAVAMMRVGGSGDIPNLLGQIPADTQGHGTRVMAITRKNMVEEFIRTVSLIYCCHFW